VVPRRVSGLAALVAFAAGLPGLRLTFFSSDWYHLWGAAEGMIGRTPFGNFRPLCSLSYWLDWRIWGLSPLPFHLTSLALVAATAAMVVVLIRRYTGDTALAAVAGVLFALHPYHVVNVAWIAARHDALSGVLLLGAALAYDRWRETARGLPLAALALYEAAMLAKESGVVLPGLLVAVAIFDRRRRPGAAEALRGYLPIALVAIAHFLLLRPAFLDALALRPLTYTGNYATNLLSFAAAAVVPGPPELMQPRPLIWGAGAVLVTAVLLAAAVARSRRIPPVVWPAAGAFVALLGPSLMSFQQRYLFLPSAAAALAIAALLRAAGRRAGTALGFLLAAGWVLAAATLWAGWASAGRASDRLMAALVEVSRLPGVHEIVVVAAPHRVRGAPVITDFSTAVSLRGGAAVAIDTAAELDYPDDRADALAEPREDAVVRGQGFVEVRLRVPPGPFSRYVQPSFEQGRDVVEREWGRIVRDGSGRLRVRVETAEGRAAYLWADGKLMPL